MLVKIIIYISGFVCGALISFLAYSEELDKTYSEMSDLHNKILEQGHELLMLKLEKLQRVRDE